LRWPKRRRPELVKERREEKPSFMFELFQPTHLLFVLVVALAVFGPKRLVEISRNLGRTMQSIQEVKEELKDELSMTPNENHDDSKNKEATRK
jgi:sec-independent protein translocase protein TatA